MSNLEAPYLHISMSSRQQLGDGTIGSLGVVLFVK
jgi:hypothetical protein